MSTRSARRRAAVWPARPWLIAFFLLTFALDIPFLVLGSVVRAPADVPLQLPFSALGFICPLLAAGALTWLQLGPRGAWALLRRVVDLHRRHWPWYVAAVAIMPSVGLISAALTRLLGRLLVPRHHCSRSRSCL